LFLPACCAASRTRLALCCGAGVEFRQRQSSIAVFNKTLFFAVFYGFFRLE
jgi:hypothetical protein